MPAVAVTCLGQHGRPGIIGIILDLGPAANVDVQAAGVNFFAAITGYDRPGGKFEFNQLLRLDQDIDLLIAIFILVDFTIDGSDGPNFGRCRFPVVD